MQTYLRCCVVVFTLDSEGRNPLSRNNNVLLFLIRRWFCKWCVRNKMPSDRLKMTFVGFETRVYWIRPHLGPIIHLMPSLMRMRSSHTWPPVDIFTMSGVNVSSTCPPFLTPSTCSRIDDPNGGSKLPKQVTHTQYYCTLTDIS